MGEDFMISYALEYIVLPIIVSTITAFVYNRVKEKKRKKEY